MSLSDVMKYELQFYRLKVRQFERMINAGVFGEDRVELLNGVLVMMTSYPPHDNAVDGLDDLLIDRLPRSDWTIREEKPIKLHQFWRPQPDIAVVRGPRESYAERTPTRRDVALIVEVSDTTYAKDSGLKLRLYERCGIPAYWIVDLPRRRVEVRLLQNQSFGPAAIYHDHEEVPVVLDGREFGRFPVREILP